MIVILAGPAVGQTGAMLQLRPNCEYCDADLPPASGQARICSYECTFCTACAEGVLHGVCPNCGGGLVPRPIRPAKAWRPGVSLEHQPASRERVHLRRTPDEVEALIAQLRDVPAAER